jgi:hypothetical protein
MGLTCKNTPLTHPVSELPNDLKIEFSNFELFMNYVTNYERQKWVVKKCFWWHREEVGTL